MLKWKLRLPPDSRAQRVSVPKGTAKRVRKTLMPRPPKLSRVSQEPASSSKSQPRRHAVDAPKTFALSERVARLQAVRTKHVALQLASFHLFKPMTDLRTDVLVPSRGLSAQLQQRQEPHPWVFIVDVFTRWGRELADVATVREDGRLDRVAETEDCSHLSVAAVPRAWEESKILADRICDSRPQPLDGKSHLEQVDHPHWPSVITPLAATLHAAVLGHTVQRRSDKGSVRFVLDIPAPHMVEVRPFRCVTCQRSGAKESQNYFAVQDDDLREQLPGQSLNLFLMGHGVRHVAIIE
eukprot:s179_g5.t1